MRTGLSGNVGTGCRAIFELGVGLGLGLGLRAKGITTIAITLRYAYEHMNATRAVYDVV